MIEKSTVRSVTFDLLRSLGLTTVFGNPGSTEQPYLQEFPDDFRYILALQEATVIAMADTFAQVTRRPKRRLGRGCRPGREALWAAAQHRLPIVYVVMRNSEYSILKSFAVLEETPGVPGLDLPGLGISSVARGFACRAADVATAEELEQEFKTALSAGTTTVIVVSTQPQKAML